MFFASPVIRRSAFAAPHQADLALQRFLQASQQAAAGSTGYSATTTEDATTLSVDVPGLAREQLQLRIEDAQVHLNSIEGAPRQVRRSWELPHAIDAAASSAKLENGVLTLVLTQRKPVDQSVSLNIQ
ncbi:Hsp20/alpha crystallin family protein [Comamonas sp. GB3 AK4-5]|uniref:Hsp20/alpha crystallin family protein n=1 Tax=Comamonas sp. GB3 AK4-5 TaxID=3231487 RepID=UPI00351DEF5A